MKTRNALLACTLLGALVPAAYAESSVVETLKEGDVIADFRLRYESNDTDDATDKATAVTFRSRLGYETPSIGGFKVLFDYESNFALVDEYRIEDPQYDVVLDPEESEFNRFQISYSKNGYSAVLGRQRIILDNARFVGNVGWRNNEQTFDGFRMGYKNSEWNMTYAYIDQVNTILFTEADTSHNLFNVSYSGMKFGTLTAYAYLLDFDETDTENDTYGLRFTGKHAVNEKLSVLYTAEYATQSTDSFDADYMSLEAGMQVKGVTAAIGNEVLGSDDGNYGFQTPLATKHPYNGWADKFLSTPAGGLSDSYLKLATVLSGVKLLAFYHEYESDVGSTNWGDEINLLVAKKIGKNYTAGVKYADYSAGDVGADTQKAWLWIEASF